MRILAAGGAGYIGSVLVPMLQEHGYDVDVADLLWFVGDTISSALIGVASVLAAMFIPMAYFGGTQGIIYRQFSVTLISAMGLSVIVALVLTPPLCALLLRPHNHEKKQNIFSKSLNGFNVYFNKFSKWYQKSVRFILGKAKIFLLIYGFFVAAMAYLAVKMPTSFIPTEDQGLIITQIQLPTGSTFEQTKKTIEKVADFYSKQEYVVPVRVRCRAAR